MVLQVSSDTTGGDTFNENPPASDDDPYSSSTTQTSSASYPINGLNLPQPLPIFGPLLGFNHDRFAKFCRLRIEQHSQMLKRAPTQAEAEAIAFWAAKQFSITSYGGFVGILGGLWRAQNTHATLRFPFWQPNLATFKPELFINERFALFRGNRAVVFWHLLRYSTYSAIGKNIGDVLFGSYAMTVAAVGEMGDTRLKALTEAAREQAHRKRGGFQGPKMPGTVGSPQNGRTGQSSPPPVDDASPTGGMLHEESNGFRNETYSANDAPQRPEQGLPPPTRWPQRPQPPPEPVQQTQTQDDPFFTFDDASPTGGAGARADTPAHQPQRQGSAWDRVRRGAGKAPTGRQTDSEQVQQQSGGWVGTREQTQDPTDSNEYAFSRSDEERNLARIEAQKEFDSRVERERRGGDFSSGSGDQKRW